MEQPSWIPLRLRESNSNPAGSAVLALAATRATVPGWQPVALRPPAPLRIPRHAASCTAASNATASNATASTAGATSASDTAASSTANTATLPVPLLPAQKSKII